MFTNLSHPARAQAGSRLSQRIQNGLNQLLAFFEKIEGAILEGPVEAETLCCGHDHRRGFVCRDVEAMKAFVLAGLDHGCDPLAAVLHDLPEPDANDFMLGLKLARMQDRWQGGEPGDQFEIGTDMVREASGILWGFR